MTRTTLSLLLVAAVAALPTTAPAAPAAGAPGPQHTLAVSGEGVTMFPAYDPGIERYAVTTSAATAGRLTVSASTTDPQGRIYVDGMLDPDGTATVTGLSDGDEVSVLIDDAAGRAVHSVVYLPRGFPRLEARTSEPGASQGHVFLTLNRFAGNPTTDVYEAVVDRHGVPVFAHANRVAASQDFKPTGRGGYQVFRDDAVDDRGSLLVELDAAFRPVRSVRTEMPLTQTDAHDAILLPDGSRIMGAYEPDPAHHGRQDSVIQHIDPDGTVVLTWNSADHMRPVDPTLTGAAREAAMRDTDTMNPFVGDTPFSDPTRPVTLRQDYAHVNSWELVDGGQNLLLSFRHTSSVMKVAWVGERTDGREPGEVIWRLGGKFSDFEFRDDPHLGPCAQHTARQLENGNILIFDNGSPSPSALFPDSAYCPDPADVTGEPIGRAFSRVTEYAVDEQARTATLVREFTRTGTEQAQPWFALFAGGVERLSGGHDLIAWASARQAVATEMDPATGQVLWELWDAGDHGHSPFFSYRAFKTVVPDVIAPTVTIADGPGTVPQGGPVPSVHRCTDRGGSSLTGCQVSLDTNTPGPATLTVTATDGAGNVTTRTREYVVTPAPTPVPDPPDPTPLPLVPRPDLAVKGPGGKWVGHGVVGAPQRVVVRTRGKARTVRVRLGNDGGAPTRLRVDGTGPNRRFAVSYRLGGRVVTGKVRRGRLRTPVLQPGERVLLRMRVEPRAAARPGDRRRFRVVARSTVDPSLRDAVRAVVRRTR